MIAAVFLSLPLAAAQDLTIGGVLYEKRATRAETLDAMIDALTPEDGDWGEWHLLSPFPWDGFGTLGAPAEPEEELARMGAGGPGPDLAREYEGKGGATIRWQPLPNATNQRVDLKVNATEELNIEAVCYLYVPVVADRALETELSMGSDDGVRLWVNGELVHDLDVPRGMTPDDDTLRFSLVEGVNHCLFKISQGQGGWEFQINTREPLADELDAQLFYQLDRDFPPTREREHYRVITLPVTEGIALEVGGLDFLADGAPIVCNRRGEVYVVENAYAEPPRGVGYRKIAEGLHEPLGLAVRTDSDGEAAYLVQRAELTRLLDRDGDGNVDRYETFSDDWGVSGNYHEFAFGPKFDAEGNAWVTLNIGFCGSLGKSLVPYRGWALKITPDGETIPVCDGLRSPNGIGFWTDGTPFYVDNQGDYVATNRMSQLAPGSWHGHPASLRWRDDLDSPDARPRRQPASVWFPYKKMGQSAADIALDTTGGSFGPFAGQFFVGDQTLAAVMRVDLEQVTGHWQGACFPFLEGLASGVNRLAFAPDGSLFAGETDRGWASVGRKRYGLERIVYTGSPPFDIQHMRARSDGFVLEFTQDVDPATGGDPASYSMSSYTYDYHADYGAPEKDTAEVRIVSATVTDRRKVRLVVEPLRPGYVHELNAGGVRTTGGEDLLHANAYYTLQNVPGRPATALPDDLPKLLFLTHSAGFVHDVVERPRPHIFAHAEERLIEAATGIFDVTATQDCGALTAQNLAEHEALVFYTTGELPVTDEQKAALMDWIAQGGAFVGVHSATDTFYEFPPYQELLGGAFDGHPWTQEVRVRVEDGGHPATAHLPATFEVEDEIYQHRAFRRHPVRVLMSLDTTSVDASLGARADGDYALAWCRDWGRGRVFYTALGHRAELWQDPSFLTHLLGGAKWAVEGPDYAPPPPRGAVPLLVGDDLSRWHQRAGGPAQWTVGDGVMEVAAGTGDLVTHDAFGDFLLHLEFNVPKFPDDVTGQDRGNSGVYVHGRYEVQVLDSFGLEPELGDCAAIYELKTPDTNASRRPGRWQTYDIEFRAPRFDASGGKTESARMSVWHNGIPVHRDVELPGPTPGAMLANEAARGPLLLQDHGAPVRYRNVWLLPRR